MPELPEVEAAAALARRILVGRRLVAVTTHHPSQRRALPPRHAARLNNFRHIPAKRLLVETDAPTKPPAGALNRHPLPPAADGSAVNHPANIAVAYEQLAKLRGIGEETLAKQVEQNFVRLFG